MFSAPSTSEQQIYDFEKEENALKWKGLLISALRKVILIIVIVFWLTEMYWSSCVIIDLA